MDPNLDVESQDSEDSNRESADQNDYPEEEKDYGFENNSEASSEDEYG